MGSRGFEPPPGEVPAPEIRQALESSDRVAQAAALVPILLAMGPEDADAITARFESAFVAGTADRLSLELLVERLARLDPQRGYDRILTWPVEVRTRAWPTLLRVWARSSPDFALAALNRIRDADVREAAFPSVMRGWAESGQPGLWRYLASVRDPWHREGGVIAAVRQRLARDGTDATLRELEQLAAAPGLEDFSDAALRTATGLLARSDPERAAAVAMAHRGEERGTRLMRRVAVNWVTQDGPAAMHWLLAQPAGAGRKRVMRETFRRWLVRDREAATAWVLQRPERAGLEAIFDMQATALARRDPAAALAWVEGIEDPTLRREASLDLGLVWHHRDPESARPWLERRGLLEEVLRLKQKRPGQPGTRREQEAALDAQPPQT